MYKIIKIITSKWIPIWMGMTVKILFANTMILGATSTTVNSGLMDYLLPYYTKETGNEVKIITGGTGFILQQLERGDIEIAITHHKMQEENLLSKFPQGRRTPFMYNTFIIVGPKNDPAQIKNANSYNQALANIEKEKSLFISRGDNSGSHKFEMQIWNELDIDEDKRQRPWYIESGQDVGSTLNMASAMNAYMIADEGTWLAYADKSQLQFFYANKEKGKNEYSVIQLKSNEELSLQAAEFAEWLLQDNTKILINTYQINDQQGFFAY